jgi:hypothetical protein
MTELTNIKTADDFRPIDPKDYHWQPGKTIKVETKINFDWCPVTYNLTVVKPLTFQELTELTRNAVKRSGEDLFRNLFQVWYQAAKDVGLIDLESFQAAAQKAKEKKNGNG